MSSPPQNTDNDRAGRTLIKAFAFAGGILGLGAFGLLRTIILFGRDLEWLSTEPDLGSGLWWLGGGVLLGLVMGWTLVRLRRRKR